MRHALIKTVAGALVGVAGGLAIVAAQPPPASKGPEAVLSVETVGIEPTVMKTGDLVTATYRLRFPDLVRTGRELVVLEDRIVPDTLPVAPFEAVSLETMKRRIGDQHVWDLRYRLRIIKPPKGSQVIPGFNLYWLVRDLGQPVEKATVLQTKTEPLAVRHVTTITEMPMLDIRDGIELGSFGQRATALRTVALIVAPLPLIVWTAQLVRTTRRQHRQRTRARKVAPTPAPIVAMLPTRGEARRNLQGVLKQLKDSAPGANEDALRELQRVLVISLREYLMAELPDISSGDTARDIKRHVDTAPGADSRQAAFSTLAGRLAELQAGLESGTLVPFGDPAADAAEIEQALNDLQPRARLIRRVLGWLPGEGTTWVSRAR